VTQAGSVVEPDRLRFDFSHFQATSPDELRLIEDLCYEKILANDPVRWSYMPLGEAKAKGAMALFGEKYGSEVRVVETGDYSLELCGGTHVRATGEIGAFVFAYEGSVGAGHRRVEVLTGAAVLQRLREYDALIHEAAHMLGTTKPDEIVLAAERYSARTRALEKELERLQSKQAGSQADALAASFEPLNGFKFLVSEVSAPTLDVQKNLVDQLLAKAGEGAVLTLAKVDGKLTLVGKASSEAVAKGVHVGKILAEAAKIAGGGGGGRPDFAQAGARDPSKIAEALAAARKLLLEALS
jgi:alanyl-tRNA synthetase